MGTGSGTSSPLTFSMVVLGDFPNYVSTSQIIGKWGERGGFSPLLLSRKFTNLFVLLSSSGNVYIIICIWIWIHWCRLFFHVRWSIFDFMNNDDPKHIKEGWRLIIFNCDDWGSFWLPKNIRRLESHHFSLNYAWPQIPTIFASKD